MATKNSLYDIAAADQRIAMQTATDELGTAMQTLLRHHIEERGLSPNAAYRETKEELESHLEHLKQRIEAGLASTAREKRRQGYK